jgi:hypothetical protein
MACLVAWPVLSGLERDWRYRTAEAARVGRSRAVHAGNWLAQHYPKGSLIVYDHYSYVPEVFGDAHRTCWGGTVELLASARPAVVVVSTKISSRFADAAMAASYAGGESEFMERYAYYRALSDGSESYTLARDFGEVAIYKRRTPGALSPPKNERAEAALRSLQECT